MKKLMILLVCSTLAFGASSCKKNGDCVCTIGGVSATTATGVSKADCQKLDDALAGTGSCKLK